jgi:hypothetical protein
MRRFELRIRSDMVLHRNIYGRALCLYLQVLFGVVASLTFLFTKL